MVAGERGSRRLFALLAIGTVPAAVAGIALGDYFEESFEDPPAAAVQLVVTALILVAGERVAARRTSARRAISELTPTDAALVGTAQAVSILPGISRSGATIATALGLSVARDDAARFSFLLAIPALFGAALVQLPDLSGTSLGTGAGIVGFVASLVTSYAAIWAMIRYLRTRTLYPFAVYCVVAGVIFYLLV